MIVLKYIGFNGFWWNEYREGKRMDGGMPDSTAAIIIRIATLEQDVAELKRQLNLFVPLRENELQLKNIRDSVDRIERDIADAKRQLMDVNSRLATQDTEAQKRESEIRESQASLQIRVLWGSLSLIIGLLMSVLVGYITHFFR